MSSTPARLQLRDCDQTAADQDQTWSDHDQSASDRDQRSADEDQDASDADLAAGGDPVAPQRSVVRDRFTHDRQTVSESRDESAAARLQTAEDRDRLAPLHDLQHDADASSEDILLRVEADRARAAADRARAAEDRALAAADRIEAARQRAEALRLRAEARRNLELATTDALTGAWTRKFGFAEVTREIERAHRTGGNLVLAFVDVDGLKKVNDSQGHLAGDALLRRVGEALRAKVRPYDVVVRYGGDEFLCAMPNLSLAAAKKRLQKVSAILKDANQAGSITFGLAESGISDSLEELVARADADLLNARRLRAGNV